MKIEIIQLDHTRIAEVISDGLLISSAEDGLELLVNIYYQDFDKILLYEKNISAQFFDLSSGIAGDILQKFSNFRVRLAIVGEFNTYASKSLNDFMKESNKRGHINFVTSRQEAIDKLIR